MSRDWTRKNDDDAMLSSSSVSVAVAAVAAVAAVLAMTARYSHILLWLSKESDGGGGWTMESKGVCYRSTIVECDRFFFRSFIARNGSCSM